MEIVRALLSAPQVLFLDEPTVGLDTRIRHDLFDIITRLSDLTGVTILMTTHYLDEAERLCDRLAVIDAGTVLPVTVRPASWHRWATRYWPLQSCLTRSPPPAR